MKVKINYRKSADPNYLPCVAEGSYSGLVFTGFGDSYLEAKNELLKRIAEYREKDIEIIPEPEEVEVQ